MRSLAIVILFDIPSGVLAAAIRVAQEAGLGPLPLDPHGQGSQRQFGAHVVAHCPAQASRLNGTRTTARYGPALVRRNMLFRWFVGLSMDAPVWDVTVSTKNRERLLAAVLGQPKVKVLLSDEHFSVDCSP